MACRSTRAWAPYMRAAAMSSPWLSITATASGLASFSASAMAAAMAFWASARSSVTCCRISASKNLRNEPSDTVRLFDVDVVRAFDELHTGVGQVPCVREFLLLALFVGLRGDQQQHGHFDVGK